MENQLLAFLEFLQQKYNYSPNTIAAYKNDLNQFLRFIQKRYAYMEKWVDVTESEIRAYIQYMDEQDYASSSVARKVAAVKSFFNHLTKNQTIRINPSAEIESPKVEKRLPQPLSLDDVELLLEAPKQEESAKNLRDTALLTTLYATGMRVTEVVSLQVEDVDMNGRVLRCIGKDGEVRHLPFDEETQSVLKAYLENGRPHLLKHDNEQALFLNHRGQQLTRQGLWLITKAYAKEVDLTGPVTPHTLRHSFAAHKLARGTNLQEVQHLLGHANISTTQIYTQIEQNGDEEDAKPTTTA
jgi:integrase/recombinase XerD